MSDTAKHLCSGTAAGLLAKIVEFPLDTIKVRVQADAKAYHGYMHCAKSILRNEGFLSFYRGIGAPMLGGGAENAVCFTAFAFGGDVYRRLFSVHSRADASAGEVVFSGMMAGCAVAHVLTPVELLKCNMQVQNMRKPEDREYKSVIDCARKTIRKGGIKSLFTGHTATLAREVPGNGAWFGFYHLTKRMLTPAGTSSDDLPIWKLMLSGGVGGVTYWTAFFPADVVKTRMQIDPVYGKLGLVRGLGALYKEGGMRTLYSGWSITALRAFPANAIIFSVYEVCASHWDNVLFPEVPKIV
jgi:solute carrier family 25 (mitochondrial carnitine/acylcarnitine transporter), member 20/29